MKNFPSSKSMDNLRRDTLKENKNFIINIIEEVCSKDVNWNKDSEVSIGLLALNHCISSHNTSLGNFTLYAKSYVKNALLAFLIDNSIEILFIDNYSFISKDLKSLTSIELEIFNNNIEDEVLTLTKALKRYRINYKKVMKSFPKDLSMRNLFLHIACYCTQNTRIGDLIIKKKSLPYSHLCKKFTLSKDTLFFYEKYIIILFIIFSSNDYIFLKSFLSVKAGVKNE